MFQWASTLTVSGANMPFALPLQADSTPDGFDIAFLRVIDGTVIRIAKIACKVEPVEGVCALQTLLHARTFVQGPGTWAVALVVLHSRAWCASSTLSNNMQRTALVSGGSQAGYVQDQIFFARFHAIEPFPDGRVPPGDEDAKLKALLNGTKDVPIIMNTMSGAIRQVAKASWQE
jgi:hypothetical protein